MLIDLLLGAGMLTVIAIGSVGFLLGILFDVASARGLTRVKPIIWTALSLLMGYSHLAAAFSSDKFALSALLSWLGWPLLLAGTALLCYSLFFEIPFNQTFVKSGSSDALVQVGTYALTRHPGVLWYAIALSGMVLVSRSWLALVAAPVWLLMDIVWVWVEDHYLFEQMFHGYNEYKKRTPMLIPNRVSMGRCWQTLALRPAVAQRLRAGANAKMR